MADSALLETIMVATEAKTEAMLAKGRVSGTPTDAVITACEGEIKHQYPAGSPSGPEGAGRGVKGRARSPEQVRERDRNGAGVFYLEPV